MLDEELLRTTVEVARIGICFIDESGRFVHVNPAFCKLSGFEPGELIGEHWTRAAPPDVAGQHARFFKALLADSPKVPDIWQIRRADGSVLDALVSWKALAGRDGQRYVVVTFSDVTERRQAAERARQLNAELDARLRQLIDTANDAVITINETSLILDWNTQAEKTFGWTRAEAVGRILTDLIVPSKHRAHHHRGLERFLATGEQGILNRRIETTALARDGREFDVELSVWPVKTAEGYTFSSFIRDISQRKGALEALRASEEKYRLVVENANDGIIVSQDGRIKYGNARAFALADRTEEEVYATPFIEMIHPEDRGRVYDNYLRRMRGEPVENYYRFRVLSPRGDLRWLQISAVMIEWEQRPATLNFLSDVTEEVKLQDSLREALAREHELSELKSRFVAMTSHEFRTPLATIMSAVELLEDFGPGLPAGQRDEVMGLIKGALRRMTGMLGQVLLIGRAEAGGLAFRPAPLDAQAFCRQLLDEARRAAGKPVKVELVQHGATAAPRQLDEQLLRHTVGNLLSNALKYSPPDGAVTLTLEAAEDALTFRVSDQGIGIPPEDQAQLFGTFHRGSNVGNVEGTGLGLAIVKQCAALHGGTIEFESAPGSGTTFTLRVPAPAA